MRKIKLIGIIMLLVSCTSTEYATVPLPEFNPAVPERPKLEMISGSVPDEVNLNTIRLMSYCKELESYGKSWREFYSSLKEK